MSGQGTESELQNLIAAAQDVISALERASEDVSAVKQRTEATSRDVEEVLGGTATAADRDMLTALEEAHGASSSASGALSDAAFAVERVIQAL